MPHSNFKDLTGKVFERLTVEAGEKGRGPVRWVCRCTCGKVLTIFSANLLRGNTKSCGCLAKELFLKRARGSTKSRAGKGEAGLNRLYSRLVADAEKHHRKFELSLDQVKKITACNCVYCGVEPKQGSYCKSKKLSKEALENSKYIYNGIDRVNNSKGYEIGNCVPCCGSCNKSKTNKTLFNWFSSLAKILKVKIKIRDRVSAVEDYAKHFFDPT
jgi:hypothetical protein